MPQKSTPARSRRQTREANPNWGGGRVVASNGYVLIRVGTQHPLADVRGYAYEHRLVASKTLGRWLESSEQVHHKNEIKTDNRPENLEVVSSMAEHRLRHRTRTDLRVPGEDNPEIVCTCGCGFKFPKYDDCGRPRSYVSGHNPHIAPVADEVCLLLERLGPLTNTEIVELFGRPMARVNTLLFRLHRQGKIVKIRRGLWAAKEKPRG